MFRTFDLVLIGVMTATALVTYTIKHKADLKLEEVHRLETEIKLERDTIDLLKADWALLTQPNRLHRLIAVYQSELNLVPTEPTQLAMPTELPMPKSLLPQPETTIEELIAGADPEVRAAIRAVDKVKASKTTAAVPIPLPRGASSIDVISTGSVED
ncbi:hypothetical protein [Rhizobium sp. SSA_523]|uniref:cell division protein FtsL n=1 Tax=Rhizobium sp. SSA_523 TaxID=2952477 RepID=UPI0020904823|nr:hypothetical protein [Rhizobium sp. SSA_523]MCO5730305.1 hypothetical protein [Rhizobium sp. SSA_523]WKC25357.1 hypothetical protein QTJ18_15400 [Rhizobium sp. SSA_523]